MSDMATETLDKLAADPTAFGSVGPRTFAKLVELARLQVALNECEAPDGWTLTWQRMSAGRYMAWAEPMHNRDARICGATAATAPAALLALRDALAELRFRALNAKLTP
jgi:hypothetical protein